MDKRTRLPSTDTPCDDRGMTTTGPIKAIETRYAGCRFRSRLEARWAVFFDAMGLPWDYEPEGFELPTGRYLPDFRVWFTGERSINPSFPDNPQGFWAEIKGTTPTEREKNLATDLFWATRTPVVILSRLETVPVRCRHWDGPCQHHQALGMPGTGSFSHQGWDPSIFHEDWPALHYWTALPCWMPRGAEAFLSERHQGSLTLWRGDHNHGGVGIQEAVNMARSARFEHGESGAPLRRVELKVIEPPEGDIGLLGLTDEDREIDLLDLDFR